MNDPFHELLPALPRSDYRTSHESWWGALTRRWCEETKAQPVACFDFCFSSDPSQLQVQAMSCLLCRVANWQLQLIIIMCFAKRALQRTDGAELRTVADRWENVICLSRRRMLSFARTTLFRIESHRMCWQLTRCAHALGNNWSEVSPLLQPHISGRRSIRFVMCRAFKWNLLVVVVVIWKFWFCNRLIIWRGAGGCACNRRRRY